MEGTPQPTHFWQNQDEQPQGQPQQSQDSTYTPYLASNEPFSSPHGSPQPMSENPYQTQFIQPQIQMGMAPQQVMYIPLKYTPETNYRTVSYIVLAAGIGISILFSMAAGAIGSEPVQILSSLVCCGSFTGVVFLDAAYYKGKGDWEQANGMANGLSRASMIIEFIIGGILVVLFLFMLLGASLEL
jgi:hypothetical protein